MVCQCGFDAGGCRQKMANHVAKVHKSKNTVAKKAELTTLGKGLAPSPVIVPVSIGEVKKVVRRVVRRKPKTD